jgi:inosine-uridine nucleoside N-ribohydrolase
VEVGGELTSGVTVFDRRPEYRPRANMEVAMDVDVAAVRDAVVRGLAGIGR